MDFRLLYPAQPLKKYIRYFWMLEQRSADTEGRSFRIMADGIPGMIFQQYPEASLDHYHQQLPSLFLYGTKTQYAHMQVKGTFLDVGISFHPGVLTSLFPVPVCDLTNQYIDLDDLIRTSLSEQLLHAVTFEQKVQILESFLLQRLKRNNAPDGKTEWAIHLLQQGQTLPQVQAALNLSERSLERYFKHHIGITPKMYARIYRFQSALDLIRQSNFGSLTAVAHLRQYFDQAHFIKAFQQFAGASPKHFLRKAKEQLPNFPEWLK
ncbi:helix-turn-helix transcriptional regulator [Chitinophaga oryzae]|uniref:Helix-turn-helix transcriptional regulator n=1 Tax=Chitinophaga oryzae TaxID=2725414 RepID=A0AAE7D988_9BACT|nr:helix-turn-helix transcriptional regulator [Chitinophaga oryzae]QJB34606.1 helix-turn-helix transcriptional regulator [Chitinophaga oryzae]QJB41126.1 helix-turn-helix transcriptional regulator [Chitinophaga oryzae]